MKRKTALIVEYLLRCTSPTCNKDQTMEDVGNLNLGDVIRPATKKSKYGRCILCKHEGLLVVRRSDDQVE